MAASADNKALAKYLRSVLGGSPTVSSYRDDAHKSSVDIMSVRDVPTTGLTVYATLGLSDYPVGLQVAGVHLGVEFIMAAGTCYECAPNVLATCALNIINTKMTCRPGQVFPQVIEMYQPEGDMKHVMFVPPFLWDLETQEFPEKKVAWLLAVPISDDEYAFVRKEGSEALERVFEQRQIDIFDLDRESAV